MDTYTTSGRNKMCVCVCVCVTGICLRELWKHVWELVWEHVWDVRAWHVRVFNYVQLQRDVPFYKGWCSTYIPIYSLTPFTHRGQTCVVFITAPPPPPTFSYAVLDSPCYGLFQTVTKEDTEE